MNFIIIALVKDAALNLICNNQWMLCDDEPKYVHQLNKGIYMIMVWFGLLKWTIPCIVILSLPPPNLLIYEHDIFYILRFDLKFQKFKIWHNKFRRHFRIFSMIRLVFKQFFFHEKSNRCLNKQNIFVVNLSIQKLCKNVCSS